MSEFTTTKFGDTVAYDRRGSGPGLIFVAGAGPSRATDPWTTVTAEAAASQGITTIVYDRLGRGETTATGALRLDRELAAIRALIDVAGGSAALCGHSSGCAIALAAAAQSMPVTALALWEAPLHSGEDPIGVWAADFLRLLDAGRLEPALTQYMRDMPPEWLEGARRSPEFPQIVAQVVSYRADAEAMAWVDSAPHDKLFGGIRVPTQVMLGESTFPMLVPAADSIVAAIPGATLKRMPGANHMWDPEPMAADLAAFVDAAN